MSTEYVTHRCGHAVAVRLRGPKHWQDAEARQRSRDAARADCPACAARLAARAPAAVHRVDVTTTEDDDWWRLAVVVRTDEGTVETWRNAWQKRWHQTAPTAEMVEQDWREDTGAGRRGSVNWHRD